MSDRRLDDVVRSAIAQGLLPAGATVPRHDDRPWPIVLLTAFGAWLAAIPLFAVIGLLFSRVLTNGVGAYALGAVVLGGAIVALRRARLPLFLEQMVTPALIVGAGLLAWGAYRDLPPALASVGLALAALASALAIPRPWLRVVLGAAAATLLVLAWLPWRGGWSAHALVRFWMAWHLDLLLWLLAGIVARTMLGDGARAAIAAALESLRAGWLLATLVGLAWWSGMTFLVGATLSGGPLADIAAHLEGPAAGGATMAALRIASLLLAAGAAAWAARAWPTLRSVAGAGAALVLVALAWFLPALGATLLALAVCAAGKRWRLAATAAVGVAWIVGGFYYQLAWPLATKAVVLVAAGGALGALAWLSSRAGEPSAASSTVAADVPRWNVGNGRSLPVAVVGIVATALFVVAAANVAIWQKEDVIANGRPVFVRLAPVDPRSLMQGDYMRLEFGLPPEVLADLGGLLDRGRPHVVARRDGRDVATVLRVHKGEPLATDELRIELTPAHGDWVLVSDAWSFAEGQADRWARARYGEFRVDAKGRALLVGLRGENLEKL
jgi:uncharacterized membrane-anchored protein